MQVKALLAQCLVRGRMEYGTQWLLCQSPSAPWKGIYDKELLVIMLALSKWCHYLMDAAENVEIWTDHQNLQYFWLPQKLNQRQAHWVTKLAEYHFTLHHNPGAQTLRPTYFLDAKTMIKDAMTTVTSLFSSPCTSKPSSCLQTSEVHQQVKEATQQEDLWDEGIATSLNHQWGISRNNGLLYYDRWIYVPPQEDATVIRLVSGYP